MIKQKFNVGDEFICRVDGVWGYVILAFKACALAMGVVGIPAQVRVVPEKFLRIDSQSKDSLPHGETIGLFRNGQIVRVKTTGKQGRVLDTKQFYVVHFRRGDVKVILEEVMAKTSEKIIMPITKDYRLRTFEPA